MVRSMRCALALCALALPMPALSAPSNGDDEPLVRTGLVTVPQVSGRGWQLDGSVTTQYNSNFRRNVSGGVWRVAPQVSGGIGLPVGRQQLFVGASVGRDIFLGNQNFNRNRYRVGGGVNLRAGNRCSASVAGEIGRAQALFGDIAEIQDNVQQDRSIGAQVNCQGGVGLGFGGTVQYRETENTRPQRRIFNFESLTFSPQLTYAAPALGQFSLGASFQNVKYPLRQVLTLDGPDADELDIRAFRAGYSRELGSRLRLTLGVSNIRVTPKPSSVLLLLPGATPDEAGNIPVVVTDRQPFSALGYDGTLSLQLGDRTKITASTSRTAQPNANLGALTAVRNVHGLDVDVKLNRGLSAAVGGSLVNARYRASFASADEPLRRNSDRISRVYGQINYSPRQLYSIGLEVAHQNRTSDPVFLNFSNTTALLRLRVALGRTT
jgi:hypothetical protein